jgi:hypothetical protein
MMNTSGLASQGDPRKIADLIVQSATQEDVPAGAYENSGLGVELSQDGFVHLSNLPVICALMWIRIRVVIIEDEPFCAQYLAAMLDDTCQL